MKQVSERRRRSQGGQEIIEFGLVAIILVPLLIGTAVTGMGLVRSIKVNQICGNVANMYIHGGEFSQYSMQQLTQRLARGLNLDIGASFTTPSATNTSNGGDGIVRISKITWIGSTTDATCVYVGASNCVNHNKFVFTQRISFGNGSLSDPNTFGNPLASLVGNTGTVSNFATNTGAQLSAAGQTAMQAMWQTSAGGRTPLVDGQLLYVVEFYVRSPSLALGNMGGGAQYARYFF